MARVTATTLVVVSTTGANNGGCGGRNANPRIDGTVGPEGLFHLVYDMLFPLDGW